MSDPTAGRGPGARALRVGTRASALATAQSQHVADRITEVTGVATELVEVTTKGDVDRRPLVDFGGVGVFVGALRDALLSDRVDVAVHSLKDIPTAPSDGLVLAAVPARTDPRDVLIARDGLTLGELPVGSRVGTGSPRRAAQLRALGLGLEIVPIRGNIDTRMRLVSSGEVDAVVLARAGLSRTGRLDAITETLDPLQMLPAPGQGALAVECRRAEGGADAELAVLLQQALDDPAARTAVSAERSLLATLEAGCTAPVGALAEVALGDQGEEVWLRAVVGAVDGSQLIRMSTTGAVADAIGLGRALAEEMIAEGAGALVGERVP
ncbi:MAG TPA: hydroxymethylbilane synthase [Nocardioidaceae bacterium]|nr:hydroxymethylbilane synthase [Nocardioidaceae bacterium]